VVRAIALGLALGTVALEPAAAQADSTIIPTSQLFTKADAVLAASVVIGTLFAQRLDDHYAARLQDSSTQANKKLQTLATFVRTTAAPGALIIGTTMYAVGHVTKVDRLEELGLHGTEALVLGEFSGWVIKVAVGRQRPFVQPRNPHSYGFLRGFSDDKYRSFPSGHTVAAFAAAAAVTSQTSAWWPSSRYYIGTAMYGGAVLAGVSRMYDNRHWASDVIVGAGIGTFAGLKVIRFNSSHAGNRLDNFLLSGSIVAAGDGGHTLRWSVIPGLSLGRTPRGR
jgi:membrane-associated phospholipid phosphatase